MTKQEIINFLKKESVSQQELLIFVNERLQDQYQKKIDWNSIHPMVLQMELERIKNAYKDSVQYFKQKWFLSELNTGKKIIIIDSYSNDIYY